MAMVAGSLAVMSPAHAETCTDLPGGTTGATIEAGGQTVRVPAISRLQLCSQGGGAIGGIPVLSTEPSGECWSPCYSLILTGSSGGGDGYVMLRYYADDQPGQIGVPIPGGGPSTERCLVGVGAPKARADCEVKVSLDSAPIPLCVRDLPFCVPPEEGWLDRTIPWLTNATLGTLCRMEDVLCINWTD
ncbi:MAG: hypothetical protein M3134_05715 [Actinomycetota bacterium]|nr:hypothetical protein [Actinomycetota bacterium]